MQFIYEIFNWEQNQEDYVNDHPGTGTNNKIKTKTIQITQKNFDENVENNIRPTNTPGASHMLSTCVRDEWRTTKAGIPQHANGRPQ